MGVPARGKLQMPSRKYGISKEDQEKMAESYPTLPLKLSP